MSLLFPFIAISSVSHPTGSNGRSAEKGFYFALWKNGIMDVSLFTSYCYFRQEARQRFRKKEINFLAQQTICLRALNEQTLMRKSYVFMEGSFSHRRSACAVPTESSCCHELLNSVNDSGVEKLNHFCPWFYVRSPQSAFKLSPTDWRFAFPFKFGFQKLIII